MVESEAPARTRAIPFRDELAEIIVQTTERMSAQELIVSVLRRAILLGVIPAGARLRQRDLAAMFGTSRIPVREALYILESEGLVTSEAYRGVTVTGLDANAVEEIYEMRSALEGLAVRLAVPLLTAEDLDELRTLTERIEGAHEPNERLDHCEAFYLRLYEATGRPRLVSTIRRLRQEVVRSFRWQMGQHSHDHHAAFFDAVLAGDADKAAALLDGQYQKVSALLRRRPAAKVQVA